MHRLLFAALFVVFVGTECLSADEPAALRPSRRKVAIEKMLDSPLNWELGDREQVTLGELIEYVREQHRLTNPLGRRFARIDLWRRNHRSRNFFPHLLPGRHLAPPHAQV